MISIPKEELHRKFVVEKLSKKETAQFFDCSVTTLRVYLNKYEIEDRDERRTDFTNQRFGRLVVLCYAGKNKHDQLICTCQCDCGKVKDILLPVLCRGDTVSCGCYRRDQRWNGYEEINSTFWRDVQVGAIRRGYKFDITIEQVWDLFVRQNRQCALSGLPLTFVKKSYRHSAQQTASLDRINGDLGYTLDNVQWIHKSINRIKNVLNNNEFIAYCREVYLHNKTMADQLDIDLVNVNACRKKHTKKDI